ncbi:hypothetical protein EDC94DRAFT_654469 [Helicostylum pulchrum]|nr:hypothetical protein EDC94DRAFT_654469 [Helicostylum pulchrum]
MAASSTRNISTASSSTPVPTVTTTWKSKPQEALYLLDEEIKATREEIGELGKKRDIAAKYSE